jgi:hypothetical protein
VGLTPAANPQIADLAVGLTSVERFTRGARERAAGRLVEGRTPRPNYPRLTVFVAVPASSRENPAALPWALTS